MATLEMLPARIQAKVIQTPGGCWLWMGARDRYGYGRVQLSQPRRRTAFTHRVIYETLVGPIGDLVIDHLCRTPACCNPMHLDPTTQAENVRRGQWFKGSLRSRAAKTHCPKGHPYDEANTYRYGNSRTCRVCRRERCREWKRNHRRRG